MDGGWNGDEGWGWGGGEGGGAGGSVLPWSLDN